MENTYLYHHGIKGQKWGVRRYRNKDGSLTPAGKKRYNDMSEDARTASEIRQKKVSQMTNAELKKLNERTRLEQEYARLNPSTVQKGWKYVAATAGIMGTALAVYNNSNQLVNAGRIVGNKIIDVAGNMVVNDLKKSGW